MIKSQDLRESGKKTKGGEVHKIKFWGSGGKQQLGLVENILLWHFIFSRLWLRKKRQAWGWRELGIDKNMETPGQHSTTHPPASKNQHRPARSLLSRLSYIVSGTDFLRQKESCLPSFLLPKTGFPVHSYAVFLQADIT